MKKHTPNPTLEGLFGSAASLHHGDVYENGQVIFAQGDAANEMYRVERGFVKLAVASDGHSRAATFILRAGDCFGEGCLVADTLRSSTATSIQQSSLHRVSRQKALRRIHGRPGLAKLFVAYLVLRINRAQEDLVDQLTKSSEKRLARLLLHLARYGEPGTVAALVHIDQATLALVVGTTRSRVSFFMNSFRKRGFIQYNGGLKVNRALQTFLRESRH